MNTRCFILAALLWLFTACESDVVFERYAEIEEETWNCHEAVEFTVEIPEKALYEVELGIRHTTDFEMANLWCFVSACQEEKKIIRDTLNLRIAEPDGRWLGRGSVIKSILQPLRKSPLTLPAGTVVFKVEQGMRVDELAGVKSVGLHITRIEDETEQDNGKK